MSAAEQPQSQKSSLPYYAVFAVVALGAFALHGFEAHADVVVAPERFDHDMFASLNRLMAMMESPYVNADSIVQFHHAVDEQLHDLNLLLSSMKEVAPENAKDMQDLLLARNELEVMQSRLNVLELRIHGLDAGGASGYRVNQAAVMGLKEVPLIDVHDFESKYRHVVDLYTNVTYGEVLVTDEHNTLVEKKVSDLLYINKTSDKISPILAHRLMETFGQTKTGTR